MQGVAMNEIVIADADREGETMTARVIRYDREQRRLELAAPKLLFLHFTAMANGSRECSAAEASIGMRRAPSPRKSGRSVSSGAYPNCRHEFGIFSSS